MEGVASPERAPFNELIARYLKAVGDRREVVSDPEARILGRPRVEERSLRLCGWAKRASAAWRLRRMAPPPPTDKGLILLPGNTGGSHSAGASWLASP